MINIGLYKIKKTLSFLDKAAFNCSFFPSIDVDQDLNQHIVQLFNESAIQSLALPLDLVPLSLPDGYIIGALSTRKDAHWQVEIQEKDLDESKILNLRDGATLYAPSNVNMSLIKEIRPDLDINISATRAPQEFSRLTTSNKSIYTDHIFNISKVDMVPPTGSGVIAFLIKKEDINTRKALLSVHDKASTRVSNAERKASIKLLDQNSNRYNFHCYVEEGKFHFLAQSLEGDHKVYKHISNTFLEIEDYIIKEINQ